MQIKYPLIDKLKTPGISAWKTHLRKPYTQTARRSIWCYFHIAGHRRGSSAVKGAPEHLAGRGEPSQGAGTETEVGALL